MHIKKGDMVKVIAGRDKGKIGKVMEVRPADLKLRVEGVHIIKRHLKPNKNKAMPQGGIFEKAGLIDLCKVMLYSEALKRPVRVGSRMTDKGKKRRVAVGRGVKDTVIE